jgi:Ion channel
VDEVQASDPFVEVAFGTAVLILIIIIHGVAMRSINRRFSGAWVRVTPATSQWRVNSLLALVVGALTFVHLAETLVWALPIVWLGMLSSMRDSYFFVLESYTTLGEGDVSLPEEWRLVGPMIGMSGLFTFGWTGSVLVSIMNEYGRRDRTEASEDQREARGADQER